MLDALPELAALPWLDALLWEALDGLELELLLELGLELELLLELLLELELGLELELLEGGVEALGVGGEGVVGFVGVLALGQPLSKKTAAMIPTIPTPLSITRCIMPVLFL